MKKQKKIIIITAATVCLLAVLLFAVISIIQSTAPAEGEPSKTTDTWSAEFAAHDDKLAFLAEYLTMPSEVLDAEYHIVYHDNSTGMIPGPSDWDVRVALKVKPEDIPLWTDGFEAVSADEIDMAWWDGLALDGISLHGAAEYYKREGEYSYLVAFPESSVILKAVSTTGYNISLASVDNSDEDEAANSFVLNQSIAHFLPVFTFEITEVSRDMKADLPVSICRIFISCEEDADLISQAFEFTTGATFDERIISFVDIDSDGFLDIEITYLEAANTTYVYYRWNVFGGTQYGKYETESFFSLLCSSYRIMPETKQLLATIAHGIWPYSRELYQLTDTRNGGWLGTYDSTRWETTDWQSDKDVYIYTVHIFNDNQEIYSQSMTQDEYYDISVTRDNYLRYGTGKAIDVEEARLLLREKYGEKATMEDSGYEHEYPLSYMFEHMAVIDGVSCYKFRMSWLVDNNHWSFVDDIFVAPDGAIILSDGSIWAEQ